MTQPFMTAAELKEMYREFAVQPIKVRRYTGQGLVRPRWDADVNGHSRYYGSDELVGSVQQGDQHVVVLVEDLIASQWPGGASILASDKIVVAGKELAILAPGPRIAPDGTLIAYELQCRG